MTAPPPTTADVLAGRARWGVDCIDCIDWLKSVGDGALSLVVTSPPYEAARTYGLGFKLRGQSWVDWLRPIVAECCRVSAGLVCVNMAGQVRKHRYSPAVEWLVTDLTRLDGLVCGPAPYAWVRPGIPGSGSKRYHRRNWEPVYCFARPDRLPLAWSDNTAFGRPPRFGLGGDCSNRDADGHRANRNAFGVSDTTTRRRSGSGEREAQDPWGNRGRGHNHAGRNPDGTKKRGKSVLTRKRDGSKASVGEPYSQPVIANPGNVIRTGNGGNQLGHPLAHDNEAAMNLALAERLVCWYCPPDGIVGDPFLGSGTTVHAAFLHGRRAVGCDNRDSQVGLTARRLSTVTPNLPGM